MTDANHRQTAVSDVRRGGYPPDALPRIGDPDRDDRTGRACRNRGGLGAPFAGTVGVPRLWPGRTVCIIAGGPSLTREDCETARQAPGIKLLGINNAYEIAQLDALYACDWKWWNLHAGVSDFAGLKFTQDARVPETYPDVFRVPSEAKPGLSLDPCRIHQGQNGGYQALNLAVLLGAKRVLLLGYDMQLGPQGQVHHHGRHPQGLNNPGADQLAGWARIFESTLPDLEMAGVEVINCTRETALTCYPRMTIEQALENPKS